MKEYILSDGRSILVSPEREDAFFKQLEKQGLTATLKSDELEKSQETDQSQNIQKSQTNKDLGINLETGEVTSNTDSNLEDDSLDSQLVEENPSNEDINNKYTTILKDLGSQI